MSGVGRNDPCPCGSGKKYKKCCQPSGGVGVGYTGTDREVALAALSEFVDGPGWARIADDAEAEFWEELDPEQTALAENEVPALMSEQVFEWWLFFDYEYEPGRYIVDAYLEVAQGAPTPARSYLALARATMLRVYQVVEVRPGVGMTLRDVITGQETRVRERSATQQIQRWDIIATRIIPAGTPGDPVLDGGLLPLPPMRAEPLVEWMRDVVAENATDPVAGGASEKKLYADIVPNIHRAWIAPMKMPTLVNYDGDPLVLTRAYFDVLDRDTTVAALHGARDLERAEPEAAPPRWAWSGKGKDRKEAVVYGWFAMEDQRLVFETNSVERAERGRKLLERLAGGAVKYRVTRTEDVEQAMAAMRERGPTEAGEPPVELREAGNAAVEQQLTLHYERVARRERSTPGQHYPPRGRSIPRAQTARRRNAERARSDVREGALERRSRVRSDLDVG